MFYCFVIKKGKCLLFFLFLFFIPLSFSVGEGWPEKKSDSHKEGNLERRGDLKESDPRIKEQWERVKKGERPMKTLPLRYSRKRGNYLVFYDLEGEIIYYRYRVDTFDELAERRLPLLLEGQAYEVQGFLLGLLSKTVFIPKNADKFKRKLEHSKAILVFQFESARSLAPKKLIL